ncbi:MAG: bifunctional DNA-formamidopyrimidine glycosylase/DNA-(apurinic or apyrimidinic site) lyase [bacterium]
MPELPEVETAKAGIQPYLEQQRIQQVVIRQAQLRWQIPDAIQSLVGQTIERVWRRAKYILFETAQGTAIIHLGMSGNLRMVRSEQAAEKHDHWDMMLDNGWMLRYRDPRRFGALLWTTDALDTHPRFIDLGYEPFDAHFTADYLFQRSRKRKVPIKTFIMDAKQVVGVGNIYASESLFMAGINPQRAAGSITRQRYEKLVNAIQTVLRQAIAKGGTTLKDFVQQDGQTGYFQIELQVYGRAGEACRQCGTTIRQITQAQRSTYYCPKCQRY